MKVYISAPMNGNPIGNIIDYYSYWEGILRMQGYEVLNPMAGKMLKDELCQWGIKPQDILTNGDLDPLQDVSIWNYQNMFARDKWMVNQADIVFATLIEPFTEGLNPKISTGVLCEVAWGHILNKNVVLVINKKNQSHTHTFITSCATSLFYHDKYTDDGLKGYFGTLLNGSF